MTHDHILGKIIKMRGYTTIETAMVGGASVFFLKKYGKRGFYIVKLVM